MLRFLAFDAVFFVLPFVAYALWLLARRGSAGAVDDWPIRTIAYLSTAGVLLMALAILSFISFTGSPPGGKYTPATIQNGKIVPGHIE